MWSSDNRTNHEKTHGEAVCVSWKFWFSCLPLLHFHASCIFMFHSIFRFPHCVLRTLHPTLIQWSLFDNISHFFDASFFDTSTLRQSNSIGTSDALFTITNIPNLFLNREFPCQTKFTKFPSKDTPKIPSKSFLLINIPIPTWERLRLLFDTDTSSQRYWIHPYNAFTIKSAFLQCTYN